ncbi:MAG: hypothetical protein ACOC22_03665 [bacterium]
MDEKKLKAIVDNLNDTNVLHWDTFSDVLSTYGNFLFGGGIDMPQTKYDENDLKKGLRLISVFEVMPELLNNKEVLKELGGNYQSYSFLFKEGKKISDVVFRKGGISNGFVKGDYCNLIAYKNFFKNPKTKFSRTSSTHVLINLDGKIVLEEKGLSKYPYYLKGVIASMDKGYYNLSTGELIIKGDSSIESDDFLFVQKKYDFEWYGGKDKPKGVYKICFETGEVEYFK